MAKEKRGSFAPEDLEEGGGLFGPGPDTTAKSHVCGWFKYPGGNTKVPAVLITFERDGEEAVEKFTVGKGWKPSEDGTYMIPLGTQTGFKRNTQIGMYLDALKEECNMPKGVLTGDITVLDGISGTLSVKTMDNVREGEKDEKGAAKKPSKALVFTELDAAPWIKGKGKKRAAKPEPEEDEDTDEADDDDDEEEEKPAPKKKAKAKPAPVEEEEEEEAEEDDDDDESGDLFDEGVEALVLALDAGPLKLAKVEASVLEQLKKHPKRKEIAALMATPASLKKEIGWTFDGKTVKM